ncbi:MULTISPECIES: glutathionylspermidine synthase family protein [unclassified Bacillus (in: firmicutes)]|uniref:glutathionylspermidine synthase family protein n=1 Tax=unclassified Bacillus (in: firmicutes) TaxID=185979 RepID=UPI0008E05DEF|nr:MULTISPECIES: glutathionylspermidine synthase family protein [unclassified Bacillus (in: firmicutes)]SFA72848.1 Glutathionylspermidine synthase preATP-grasp [Bacillus sp. UNCCL13]SFQ62950.1 Glutathionylspermidine synthase preATP-grasp [Bacillus sp. cl95]
MNDYQKQRREFYRQLPDFWSDINDAEYSLFHVLPLKKELIDKVKLATETMMAIFSKTARLLRQLPEEQLLDLGFPTESLAFIKMKQFFPETIIGRFDFVNTTDGLKLLEFNSDTPTFIKECFKINGVVARKFGFSDPNRNEEALLASAINKAILESAKLVAGNAQPNVVFTAHHDHVEDWNTIRYLSGFCNVEHQLIPLQNLRISDDALIDSDGLPIDVLYRQTYPLEHMLEDKDPITDDKTGIKLLELVKRGKLAILNPPSAFLLQPKTIQALIWGLAEASRFFTKEECEAIKTYMLPTYLEADAFLGSTAFVKKPSLGREGDTITIYDQNHCELLKNKIRTFENETAVFQQYISLPKIRLETEKGEEELSYLIGSFTIAGKSSAIGVRAGEKITGNESYFLPVGIHSKEEK